MSTRLGRIIILVDDYDKALHFYKTNFFCKVLFDAVNAEGSRYLHIGFADDEHIGIWFLKAESKEQIEKIGKQTAGQPTIAVYTDEIESLYAHIKRNHVKIIEEMVATTEFKYFHCLDLYGNRITVVELNDPRI